MATTSAHSAFALLFYCHYFISSWSGDFVLQRCGGICGICICGSCLPEHSILGTNDLCKKKKLKGCSH